MPRRRSWRQRRILRFETPPQGFFVGMYRPCYIDDRTGLDDSTFAQSEAPEMRTPHRRITVRTLMVMVAAVAILLGGMIELPRLWNSPAVPRVRREVRLLGDEAQHRRGHPPGDHLLLVEHASRPGAIPGSDREDEGGGVLLRRASGQVRAGRPTALAPHHAGPGTALTASGAGLPQNFLDVTPCESDN